MTDLEKAREWAERWAGKGQHIPTEAQAAIDLIKSLPDQWVDVEKVREEADRMDKGAENAMKPGHNEFSRGYAEAMQECAEHLRGLLTPKLPTLADMTQEGREACQWMQARFKGNASDFVISEPGRMESRLWAKGGTTHIVDNRLITPLPGEPKLEWPGGVGDVETVDEPEPADPDPIHTPMQPSEVPANEPWLIECMDEKAIGARYARDSVVPWSVAALDGSFSGDYHDNEITLIHKLVPESPALPEGMRLADHEEYGRVVVAPRANTHGEESFYRTNEDTSWGASHGYRPTGEFNFLDGDQHV